MIDDAVTWLIQVLCRFLERRAAKSVRVKLSTHGIDLANVPDQEIVDGLLDSPTMEPEVIRQTIQARAEWPDVIGREG